MSTDTAEETTINAEIEAERTRALELAGRKELAIERAAEVKLSDQGGVDFDNLKNVWMTAGMLAACGPMIPPWLQGNRGGCFGICLKANELGISPLSLANWSYVVENKGVQRVAYESQFFHAIIESRKGPLKTRLRYEIVGEGDERRCKVWATFKGEVEPRVFMSDTLAKLRPGRNQYGQIKGSPLWETKPEVQLFYNAARDFARIYCPDVIAGMYGRDEIEDYKEHFQGPQNAKDVTPVTPNVAAERRAASLEASQQALTTIDAALDEAQVQPEPVAAPDKKTKAKKGAQTSDLPVVDSSDAPTAPE